MQYILEIKSLFKSDDCYMWASDILRVYSKWINNKLLNSRVILDNNKEIGIDHLIILVDGDLSELEKHSGVFRCVMFSQLTINPRITINACKLSIYPLTDEETVIAEYERYPYRAGGAGGAYFPRPDYLVAKTSDDEVALEKHKETWEELKILAAKLLNSRKKSETLYKTRKLTMKVRLNPSNAFYCYIDLGDGVKKLSLEEFQKFMGGDLLCSHQ